MSLACIACLRDLAVRHGLDADVLIEAWGEQAATRELSAGFRRPTAELFAIGDVERMYRIGLHCPETIRRWTAVAIAGRRRPTRRAPTAAR